VRAASRFGLVRYVGKQNNSSETLFIESNLACATHHCRNADFTHPTWIFWAIVAPCSAWPAQPLRWPRGARHHC